MTKLSDKKCRPCEGGTPSLSDEDIDNYQQQLKKRWKILNGSSKIAQDFEFKNFSEAMIFLNKVAEIAEKEGHHPDMRLFSWNKVTIELSTHAIGGLSENDFIMATKIESLLEG